MRHAEGREPAVAKEMTAVVMAEARAGGREAYAASVVLSRAILPA
jgi:hypothetical protein